MNKTRATILVFAMMNFVVSMTAFLFNGILDQVAASLNVSVASSGMLVSMYAYGAAIGVPIALIAFRKIRRVRMLKVMLIVAILMNIALVSIRNFDLMLLVRFTTGVSINSYAVLALATVVALSDRERLGRTIAALLAGSALAFLVGIPLTRAVSGVFDWRSIIWVLNGLSILCLVYFQLRVEEGPREQAGMNLASELKLLKNPKVLRVYLFTFLMFMGYHGVYTYITPYLLDLHPSLDGVMSLVLVLFGSASFIGNTLGGRVCDRRGYARAMMIGAVAQTMVVILMIFLQPVKWLSVAAVALWVLSAWFTGLQLNTGVAQETQNQSRFLLSLTGSSIQLGSAIGTSVSALIISQGNMRQIIFLALITSLAIVLIQWQNMKKHHR